MPNDTPARSETEELYLERQAERLRLSIEQRVERVENRLDLLTQHMVVGRTADGDECLEVNLLNVRRLAVVAADGFERVVAEDAGSHGYIETRSREVATGLRACMSATEELEGGTADIYITGGGEIVAGIASQTSGRGPSGGFEYLGSLYTHQPDGIGGLILDHMGLRLADMRRHYELQNKKRS